MVAGRKKTDSWTVASGLPPERWCKEHEKAIGNAADERGPISDWRMCGEYSMTCAQEDHVSSAGKKPGSTREKRDSEARGKGRRHGKQGLTSWHTREAGKSMMRSGSTVWTGWGVRSTEMPKTCSKYGVSTQSQPQRYMEGGCNTVTSKQDRG